MNQKPVNDKELEKDVKVLNVLMNLKTGSLDLERAAKILDTIYQKKYIGLLPEKQEEYIGDDSNSDDMETQGWTRGYNQAISEALANIGGSDDQ